MDLNETLNLLSNISLTDKKNNFKSRLRFPLENIVRLRLRELYEYDRLRKWTQRKFSAINDGARTRDPRIIIKSDKIILIGTFYFCTLSIPVIRITMTSIIDVTNITESKEMTPLSCIHCK